jgi:hypothetical protein
MSLSLAFTNMTNASLVIPSTQQQQIAQTLEDAQVVSNTQLNELLADEPPAVREEVLSINTDATNLALQVALLVPILAGLLGLFNSFRMMRLLDIKPSAIAAHPDALDENRFLATRDGMRADFIDPEGDRRRPAREILDDLLAACAPHAAELGCEPELTAVAALADDPGHVRQRMLAGVRQGDRVGPELGLLVRALAADFTAAQREQGALV